MGYNVEVSFDILKHSSVTELQEFVKEQAHSCGCKSCYEDYEYETNVQFKRNHCIMVSNFDETNTLYFIDFLKNIKSVPYLYVLLIRISIQKSHPPTYQSYPYSSPFFIRINI